VFALPQQSGCFQKQAGSDVNGLPFPALECFPRGADGLLDVRARSLLEFSEELIFAPPPWRLCSQVC
jgi:hypothetical protein